MSSSVTSTASVRKMTVKFAAGTIRCFILINLKCKIIPMTHAQIIACLLLKFVASTAQVSHCFILTEIFAAMIDSFSNPFKIII